MIVTAARKRCLRRGQDTRAGRIGIALCLGLSSMTRGYPAR